MWIVLSMLQACSPCYLRQVAPCDNADPSREALKHEPTYGCPEEHPDQLQASVCALCEQHDAGMSQSQAVETPCDDSGLPGQVLFECVVGGLRCRSASRLPGSRYASDMSQPGPMNLKSLRHENRKAGITSESSGV